MTHFCPSKPVLLTVCLVPIKLNTLFCSYYFINLSMWAIFIRKIVVTLLLESLTNEFINRISVVKFRILLIIWEEFMCLLNCQTASIKLWDFNERFI